MLSDRFTREEWTALLLAALLFAFTGTILTSLQVDEGVRQEDGTWVVEQRLPHDYHRYYPQAEQVEHSGNIGLYNVSTERHMEVACIDWASRVMRNKTNQNLPSRYRKNYTYTTGYKKPIRINPFDPTATDSFRAAAPDTVRCILHFHDHTYTRTVNITVPDQSISVPGPTEASGPVTITKNGFQITVTSKDTCTLPQDRWVNATVHPNNTITIQGTISALFPDTNPSIQTITTQNHTGASLTLHVNEGLSRAYGCQTMYNYTVYSELEDEATKRTQYNLTIDPPANITRLTLHHASPNRTRTIGTINLTQEGTQRLEAHGPAGHYQSTTRTCDQLEMTVTNLTYNQNRTNGTITVTNTGAIPINDLHIGSRIVDVYRDTPESQIHDHRTRTLPVNASHTTRFNRTSAIEELYITTPCPPPEGQEEISLSPPDE